MNDGSMCACNDVRYAPETVGDYVRDRWECVRCGTPFVRGGLVQSLLEDARATLEERRKRIAELEARLEHAEQNRSRDGWKDIVQDSPVSAIDLFCGAGGLTYGLMQAGIRVEAGIDIDEQTKHAYRANNPGAKFLCWDVAGKYCPSIAKLFRPGSIRLLAGCAPCQPFSKLTHGVERHRARDLLDNFARFVRGLLPELVTMENVPELEERGSEVYLRFVGTLEECGYRVARKVVRCEHYGVPQSRRRLVLLASRLGEIAIPEGRYRFPSQWRTVRQVIGGLRPLASGEEDPDDPLHVASLLSTTNLERIRATPHDGGTWKHWPEHLILPCHRKSTGRTYSSIYGRMWWNKPGPTMTTLCTGLGNGRFGHPEQDRAITLREAALLQSFPPAYEFWPRAQRLNRKAVGRMIGNAVPPKLAKALGEALISHVGSGSVATGAW